MDVNNIFKGLVDSGKVQILKFFVASSRFPVVQTISTLISKKLSKSSDAFRLIR